MRDTDMNGESKVYSVSNSCKIYPVNECYSTSSQTALTLPGDEGFTRSFLQIVGPFLIAGMGTVSAGLLLDSVMEWDNFRNIHQLLALVPTLLGLKGNLEMAVTARMCTAANLGQMDKWKDSIVFLRDDLMLTQIQASVVSFMAATITVGIDYLRGPGPDNWTQVLVIIISAMVTASLACLCLGLVMFFVVVFSRKCKINPDNISAPLAASIGDLSTLAIFAFVSLFFYQYRHLIWLPILCGIVVVLFASIWNYLSWRNIVVRTLMRTGWIPIITAMVISLGAGFILETADRDFPGVTVYQPVVSGICGNLLVILVCRMTTFLRHRVSLGEENTLLAHARGARFWYCSTSTSVSTTLKVLIILPIPSHVLFVFVISTFNKTTAVTPAFISVYLAIVFLHVIIMLNITRELVFVMWVRKIDPDTSSIPVLTALADLSGGACTFIIFTILRSVGDRSVPISTTTAILEATTAMYNSSISLP